MTNQNDVLAILEELAASLKDSAEQIEVKTAYDEGRLAGYYEALSTLISQCDISGISKDEIGLDGFSPESLFKSDKKAA